MKSAREFLDKLTGVWELNGIMGDTPLKQSVEARWVLDGLFVEMDCKSLLPLTPEKKPYQALYHIGYNENEDVYVMHLLDTFGVATSCTAGVGKRIDNTISFVFKYENLFVNNFSYDEAKDEWTHELTYIKDGKTLPFATKHLMRRKESLLFERTLPDKEKAQRNRELIQQQFGANAAAYATSAPHAKGASLQRLVELVKPQSHWQALDIATGAGHTAFAFAPYVKQVTASDLTAEMLKVATALADEKKIKNIDFRIADAEALPFEDGRFDLVTCRIAPHHFSHINQFVRESKRVLKKTGVLALVDNVVPSDKITAQFVDDFERLRDPSHVHCLSIEEWSQLFLEAGFDLTYTEVAAKEMDFAQWVTTQNVPAERVKRLRQMLQETPPTVSEFLKPSLKNENLTFQLAEAILIGHSQ